MSHSAKSDWDGFKIRYLLYLGLILLTICSCNRHHSKESVEAAMKQYDQLIHKMDAAGIAQLFTADGELGNMAKGRDSIRKFLSSFKNVEVLSQVSAFKSVRIKEDTAWLRGTYWQTDVVDKKDTLKLKGTYQSKWYWNKEDEQWHIRQIITEPVK